MRLTSFRRSGIALAGLAAAALTLSACSSPAATDSGDEAKASYKIGVSQFVQHPALDAATAGFKQAFDDAGVDVEWDDQNANGDQATAVTIAQGFASSDLDLVLAVATPAAQTAAQAITDKPILFTAVTDAVEGQLVESNEAPGGNVTGTSDLAPFDAQLALLKEVAPGAKKVGIVYASGEVNSQVQVDAVTEAAGPLGLEVVTKTVTTANDIAAATEALGDVDAIYVPTDNMVVAGIASLVQVAEDKQIPVIGAEAGTVESGAVITLGIDYTKLGYQTGEMALKVLEGADPATMPVEVSNEFAYVVNEGAAERMGATIPEAILAEAEKVE
ncbi:ABC transporter substrate-binding protein [Leucobacter aridicollis]|uniref:Putative ABC transport system substrate-binding protein n=1 Tax=Leucobacter aridicollis TaxID=283878 RepID=A0A852RJK2_9MICO|nr:ABC transporter substrate-binding protein [Leucobacter aridicollis]MBL3683643.1 ABC transporter substrate-binding protein [Leucobacter aridicollis]NYD28304.1 putative ABC transport system substrate-binding protein [Leucobacter aridicollis]